MSLGWQISEMWLHNRAWLRELWLLVNQQCDCPVWSTSPQTPGSRGGGWGVLSFLHAQSLQGAGPGCGMCSGSAAFLSLTREPAEALVTFSPAQGRLAEGMKAELLSSVHTMVAFEQRQEADGVLSPLQALLMLHGDVWLPCFAAHGC